jgi:hypothetical protein
MLAALAFCTLLACTSCLPGVRYMPAACITPKLLSTAEELCCYNHIMWCVATGVPDCVVHGRATTHTSQPDVPFHRPMSPRASSPYADHVPYLAILQHSPISNYCVTVPAAPSHPPGAQGPEEHGDWPQRPPERKTGLTPKLTDKIVGALGSRNIGRIVGVMGPKMTSKIVGALGE